MNVNMNIVWCILLVLWFADMVRHAQIENRLDKLEAAARKGARSRRRGSIDYATRKRKVQMDNVPRVR